MNELVDYKAKEPGSAMKFLWNCAGADHQILKYSSYADHVKYAGIGGVVLATAILAALSMGFAMHTIFDSWFVTIPVAIVWSLIVFNLDRFIVSSTGKGDGKDSISWSEAANATPRLLMAILLGLTISAPLETFIFQKEIQREWKLSMDQLAMNKKYEMNQKDRDQEIKLNEQLKTAIKESEDQQSIVNQRQKNFDDETMGKAGSRGYGTEAIKMEAELNQAKEKLKSLEYKRDQIKLEVDGYQKAMKNRQDSAMASISKENAGFLDQIMMLEKLSSHGKSIDVFDPRTNTFVKDPKDPSKNKQEEIYGIAFWPIWLVRLLFMIIEIAPVILKLMLIKSPYDYITDNVNQILEAKQGISLEHRKDEDNKLTLVKENYNPKRIVEVVKHQNEMEAENAKYAISLYAEKEKKNIKDNPSDFIKED